MSETQTFIDRAVAGTVSLSEIDDFVDQWHDSNSSQELHDFLGMTAEEYASWAANPGALVAICVLRRQNQPVASVV